MIAALTLAAPAIAGATPAPPSPATPPPTASSPATPSLDWLRSQSALCAAAVAAAEARYHLPAGLLGAIARAESGRPVSGLGDIRAWPWTIDADGRGLFLDGKAAAIAWVRAAQARGARYIDVGCLQVDLRLHPDAFADLDQAFDPARNADYAARYLLSLHAEARGDWNVAVGLYHSHTPELAADYRDRVAALGHGLITGIGAPEPLYRRALRQGTLRLALAGGGAMVLHIRQSGPHRAALGRCGVQAVLGAYLSPRVARCRPARETRRTAGPDD